MLKGIIYKAISGFYYVKSETLTAQCRARGRFRLDKSIPLVGDCVHFTTTEQNSGVIMEILPRRNTFVRPPLANIDKMVIITSAAIPITDPYLIDKMIVIALSNNCEPIICINKLDLDTADELYDIYSSIDISLVRTSAETGEGIDKLVKLVEKTTCAFTGNSGVGKSSILNAIDPDFGIKTGDISKKLGRGRHTTRHVELYELPCGAMVADTPGFSAFDTGRIVPKEELQHYFVEFEPYIGECRFLDCSHLNEPDCAVLEALSESKISTSRFNSYKRLYEQAAEHKAWEG
ncbi:MAG: ribosome small subunit-dependent GTPase A [Oscillospiraceae bacterium]|jgi:ribosome biogenesis GTPase|nr:ribosome small subunit-dependent GTPase A [Oscillospiraceae bacterium]